MKTNLAIDKLSKVEIAYLLGALRDGSFTENKKYSVYRIRIYQKNKEWLEHLRRIIERNFRKKPFLIKDKRDSVWCLTINSKEIYYKIKEISEFPESQREWNTFMDFRI